MNVLIIGGTGLISIGVIKHLLTCGADVTMLNRGQRENTLPSSIKQITGDRNEPAVLEAAAKQHFDVVIDMYCFNPTQAEQAIAAFAGKCTHYIFCSTVCTYGVEIPPNVLVDETFPQNPISGYGKNKLACEELFLAAHARGDFAATIVRPSSTYGPGRHFIDQLHFDPVSWDRIDKGLPILASGDGRTLWMSTHRDDCGKLFAYAAMNPVTYGESYNATNDRVLTWRDHFRETAAAIGKPARVYFLPPETIIAADPKRFGLLAEITQFHGAYSSEKAKAHLPDYRCTIDFPQGAKECMDDLKRRNAFANSENDAVYEGLLEKARGLMEAVRL